MTRLERKVINLFVFGSLFVGCWGCNTKHIEFVKLNESESEISLLKCDFESRNYTRSFGCRMHVSNKTYTALWQDDWCSTRTMLPDHVYLEKRNVQITSSSLTQDSSTQWTFKSDIPVCIQDGGMFGVSFVLRTGWRALSIHMVNKDDDKPLLITFLSSNIVRMRTVDNGDSTYIEVVEWSPFLVDMVYLVEIQVLESSYKIFINETLFFEYQTVVDNIPVRTAVGFQDIPGYLHYVKYGRANDTQTP